MPMAGAPSAARSPRCAAACAPATRAVRWSAPTAACSPPSSPRPAVAAPRAATACPTRSCASACGIWAPRSRPAHAPGSSGRYPAASMGKTLVIAEKPSVGQDLARVLPGPFEKHTGTGEKTARWLEGPEHVVTWAVGHLVQLAEPDEYDDKFKKWRMADLPIVPRDFKLVVRDERSEKQMKVVRDQLRRDDVEQVVNACDAGREGELIFTYIYEYVKAKKPVQRLWLNSMTNQAMREAFGQLRDGTDLSALRDAAKSRSEADWIVGMNATRAATIRLRSSFDGAVSLGRVQTPTLAIVARREDEIRAFKPEPYWVVDALFAASQERLYEGRFHAGANPRIKTEAEAQAVVA